MQGRGTFVRAGGQGHGEPARGDWWGRDKWGRAVTEGAGRGNR